jgi:hypothetical protein
MCLLQTVLSRPPALVSAVREFSVPTCLKELRRFLGLASYYRRFIPKFVSIAQPLHHLTRTFVWTEPAGSTFEELEAAPNPIGKHACLVVDECMGSEWIKSRLSTELAKTTKGPMLYLEPLRAILHHQTIQKDSTSLSSVYKGNWRVQWTAEGTWSVEPF